MKAPLLLLLALLSVGEASAQPRDARAASSQEIQTKVALESALENRLETVLRKMLGSDEVFVIANADIATDADRPELEVLPGVMVKKTLSSPAPLELPSALVKRLSLSIFFGSQVTPEEMESARKTAERMVGLKPERGDSVSVERLGTPLNGKGAEQPWISRPVTLRDLILLAALLTACGALLFVSRRFFEPFIQVMRDAAAGLQAARSAPSASQPAESAASDGVSSTAAAPLVAAPRSDEPSRKLPFSFITENDLPALTMLIPDQADLAAAMVAQYLPPSLASRFLAAMGPDKREKVLGHMSSAVLLDQNSVQELEESLRSRIDYIMGGEEKLVTLLDSSSTKLQSEIISLMEQRDPELGARLKRRVVLIEDIALLDESGLAALSRQVSVRSMAVVLKSLPQLQDEILGRLKGGLGEWMTQETALLGELPEELKEREMHRVLQALVALVREGRIILNKG